MFNEGFHSPSAAAPAAALSSKDICSCYTFVSSFTAKVKVHFYNRIGLLLFFYGTLLE